MKDNNEKAIGQKARESETLNFVSWQAQEAILNPNLDDDYKDWVVTAAVRKINKIAERKIIYDVRHAETQGSRKIHDAQESKPKERREIPSIINQLNEHLVSNAPEGIEDFTVEGIAKRIGINKRTLYGWVKNDSKFSGALERLSEVQKSDPFKTRTEEDCFVNGMTIALLLLETRERHHKSQAQ